MPTPLQSLVFHIAGSGDSGPDELAKEPPAEEKKDAKGNPSEQTGEKYTYRGDSTEETQNNVQVMIDHLSASCSCS